MGLTNSCGWLKKTVHVQEVKSNVPRPLRVTLNSPFSLSRVLINLTLHVLFISLPHGLPTHALQWPRGWCSFPPHHYSPHPLGPTWNWCKYSCRKTHLDLSYFAPNVKRPKTRLPEPSLGAVLVTKAEHSSVLLPNGVWTFLLPAPNREWKFTSLGETCLKTSHVSKLKKTALLHSSFCFSVLTKQSWVVICVFVC